MIVKRQKLLRRFIASSTKRCLLARWCGRRGRWLRTCPPSTRSGTTSRNRSGPCARTTRGRSTPLLTRWRGNIWTQMKIFLPCHQIFLLCHQIFSDCKVGVSDELYHFIHDLWLENAPIGELSWQTYALETSRAASPLSSRWVQHPNRRVYIQERHACV